MKENQHLFLLYHLHELTQLDEIKKLNNLDIYHLKIKYMKEKNLLIYDRKLEKGSGLQFMDYKFVKRWDYQMILIY